MAALGLALAKRGVLTASDVQFDLCDGVVNALGRWLDLSWGGMEWFSFSCRLCDSVIAGCGEGAVEGMASWERGRLERLFRDSSGIDPFSEHVGLRFSSGQQRNVLVAEGVMALERMCTGLGWTVLHEISNATVGYDLFGFEWVEYAATTVFWCGMESEVMWSEELGEPLDQYEGMTRAQFDECVPAKRAREARRLGRKELRALAAGNDPQVASVARTLLALGRLKGVGAAFETEHLMAELDWYDCIEPGVLVGWADMRPVFEIQDSYGNELMNSGNDLRDCLGVVGVPLDEESSLRRLEMKWMLPARKLRLADSLLSLIAKEV